MSAHKTSLLTAASARSSAPTAPHASPRPRRRLLLAGAAALGAAWLQPATVRAQAQAWPQRPVRLLVGSPAGGAPDILARLYAERLGTLWGQSVTVENRVGAQGTIAADAIARGTPDGYTLMFAAMSTHVITPLLMARPPFDPITQFTPLGVVASSAAVLVASAALPLASLRDLTTQARSAGPVLTFASAGNGSIPHIAGEMLKRAAGINLTHVPYKGFAQAAPDLIAGRVAVMFNAIAPVLGLIREGKLRALAVTAARRSEALPDVPTFAELGVQGMEINGWYAFFGPPGMPVEATQRISTDALRVAQMPETRARYAQLGLDASTATHTELADLLKADVARWREVIRVNGITAE